MAHHHSRPRFRADDEYSPKGREHTTLACKHTRFVVTTLFNCGCYRSIEVDSPLGLEFVAVPR